MFLPFGRSRERDPSEKRFLIHLFEAYDFPKKEARIASGLNA